jgi:hypothetical protein
MAPAAEAKMARRRRNGEARRAIRTVFLVNALLRSLQGAALRDLVAARPRGIGQGREIGRLPEAVRGRSGRRDLLVDPGVQ